MSEITSPIMLDETGQDLVAEAQNIVTKLQALINAVKPTAADIPLAAISGMTADDVQEGVAELKSNLTTLNNSLTQLTTPITSTSTGVLNVNDTFQISANILEHRIIIISARRQGVGNSTAFLLGDLLSYDNGFFLPADANMGYKLKCSNTGLLTLVSVVGGANAPNLIITGIL